MDIQNLLSAIETELQRQVSRLDEPRTRPFHEMLTYHLGWTGAGAGPEAAGKRVRPLMVLLVVLSLTVATSSTAVGGSLTETMVMLTVALSEPPLPSEIV